jgi:hypothetical protein
MGVVAVTPQSLAEAFAAIRPMAAHPAEPLLAALAPVLARVGLELGKSPGIPGNADL